ISDSCSVVCVRCCLLISSGSGRSYFFFSSRRRHTRFSRDWSSDVCSSDLRCSESTPAPAEWRGSDHHRLGPRLDLGLDPAIDGADRKSTRLNSSHVKISYAVFCLKKKKKNYNILKIENTQNVLINQKKQRY